MSKQHGARYCIVLLAVAFVATGMLGVGAALGSGISDNLSAPTIENFDSGVQPGGLRLKEPQGVDGGSSAAGNSSPESELLLVTRQSCPTPVQSNPPLSAIPLPGGGAGDGEWVLLAGPGWTKNRGFGAKGPILIETDEGRESANWYFTVEMLFVPKGRWNMRASLAIDGDDLQDAISAPAPKFNPLHIGVAIAFDHGDESPLVLELGYSRLPLEGRVLSVQPNGAPPDQVLSETRIFSACLNIQW